MLKVDSFWNAIEKYVSNVIQDNTIFFITKSSMFLLRRQPFSFNLIIWVIRT